MPEPTAISPTRAQSTTQPRASNFNVPLNGFRGWCAFLVFLYHVANANVIAMDGYGPAVELALSSLRYGVELFFLISGYVISSSLVRHKTLSAFMRDRFIRIYAAWTPLIVLVSLVCATLHLKMFEHTTPLEAFGLFLGNWLLLPPLAPIPLVHAVSWSLTYEWVFYFAAASGVIVLSRPRSQARLLRAGWLLAVATFIALFPRALFFVPGVLVFTQRAWLEQHKRWLRWPIVSFLVFMGAWRMTGADKAELTETFFDWARDGRWLPAVVAFVAASHLFASVTLGVTRELGFLESRAWQFLGKISYSFYLWHLLVVAAMKRVIGPLVIPYTNAEVGVVCVAIGTFLVSIPVAWVSYELLEVRLAKRLRSWLMRQPRLVATPLGAPSAVVPAAPIELPPA